MIHETLQSYFMKLLERDYMFNARIFLCLAATPLLFGCAAFGPEKPVAPPEATPVEASIHSAADRIEKQLADLSVATQGAPAVAGVRPNGKGLPAWMSTSLELRWNGELEPLLADMVKRSGDDVKLVVIGKPGLPILVAMNGKYTIVDALFNLGAQAGSKADIVVTGKTIELRYRGL